MNLKKLVQETSSGPGRIFTFVILMVGLSSVSIPTGLLASSLQEGARKS